MIRINGVDRESTVAQYDPNKHGTYHMIDNPELFEPQRGNNFELIVTGLGGLTKAGMQDTDSNSAIGSEAEAQETIRLAVSQAFVPSFSQTPIEIKRGNSTIKYAGTPTFSEGTIRVNDYIGLGTLETLYAWQAKSYNVLTEKVGVGQDYKKTAYLMEYTPDFQLVRTWVLYGCWISNLTEDTFDSSNQNNLHTISATIQYDKGMIDRSSEE